MKKYRRNQNYNFQWTKLTKTVLFPDFMSIIKTVLSECTISNG